MNVYRFRSVDNLFGKHNELERRSIYFASPEELNDPAEDFRDLVWDGDSIVWHNLLKNYIYCYHHAYQYLLVVTDTEAIPIENIPIQIFGAWKGFPTEQYQDLFQDICHTAEQELSISSIASHVAALPRKIRYHELLFYLTTLQHHLLPIFRKHHIARGLEPSDSTPTNISHNESILTRTNLFDYMEEHPEFYNNEAIHFFRKGANFNVIHKYKLLGQCRTLMAYNVVNLTLDFPKVYLAQFNRLLFPQWYAVSFCKNFNNPSLWSSYADSHKGICLIFNSNRKRDENRITLDQEVYVSNEDAEVVKVQRKRTSMIFYDMRYQDVQEEINFFRSIGMLPQPALMNLWYTDEEGNVSDCADHTTENPDITEWRHQYWDNYMRDIQIKGEMWKGEEEARLILYSSINDLSDQRSRTLTYDFKDLTGIIFGVNTLDNDKIRIIDTIRKKCLNSGRTSFNFYQAFYSHTTGEIEKDLVLSDPMTAYATENPAPI